MCSPTAVPVRPVLPRRCVWRIRFRTYGNYSPPRRGGVATVAIALALRGAPLQLILNSPPTPAQTLAARIAGSAAVCIPPSLFGGRERGPPRRGLQVAVEHVVQLLSRLAANSFPRLLPVGARAAHS